MSLNTNEMISKLTKKRILNNKLLDCAALEDSYSDCIKMNKILDILGIVDIQSLPIICGSGLNNDLYKHSFMLIELIDAIYQSEKNNNIYISKIYNSWNKNLINNINNVINNKKNKIINSALNKLKTEYNNIINSIDTNSNTNKQLSNYLFVNICIYLHKINILLKTNVFVNNLKMNYMSTIGKNILDNNNNSTKIVDKFILHYNKYSNLFIEKNPKKIIFSNPLHFLIIKENKTNYIAIESLKYMEKLVGTKFRINTELDSTKYNLTIDNNTIFVYYNNNLVLLFNNISKNEGVFIPSIDSDYINIYMNAFNLLKNINPIIKQSEMKSSTGFFSKLKQKIKNKLKKK